jgi:hypothetical protein
VLVSVFAPGYSNLISRACFCVPVGLGAVPVHSDVVTHKEELEMLNSKASLVSTPYGLNMRMGYFLLQNFFIQAAQEMREITSNNFHLVEDEFGEECLKYVPNL